MRFKQFGLRTLLISITVVGVSWGWFVSNSIEAQKEERLIQKLDVRHGGVAITDSSTELFCGNGLTGLAIRTPTSFPNRVMANFWPQIFERVTEVSLNDEGYHDETLNIVAQLPHLKCLTLFKTSITLSKLDEFQKLHPRVMVKLID